MYVIIWKYKVTDAQREHFEREYGVAGVWSRMFSASGDYLGSILSRVTQGNNEYILLDQWTSRTAYESFLEAGAAEYQSLSSRMSSLYSVEQRVGAFERIH